MHRSAGWRAALAGKQPVSLRSIVRHAVLRRAAVGCWRAARRPEFQSFMYHSVADEDESACNVLLTATTPASYAADEVAARARLPNS